MCVTENPPKKKPRTHFNIDMRRPVFIAAVGCRMVYLPSLMCPKSGLCAAEQDIYYFLPSTPLLLFIHHLSLFLSTICLYCIKKANANSIISIPVCVAIFYIECVCVICVLDCCLSSHGLSKITDGRSSAKCIKERSYPTLFL